MYMLAMILFVGWGYTSAIVAPDPVSLDDCKKQGAATGFQEMPPAMNADGTVNNLPSRGWRCVRV